MNFLLAGLFATRKFLIPKCDLQVELSNLDDSGCGCDEATEEKAEAKID